MGEFFKIILYRPLGVKDAAEANEKLPRKTTQKILDLIKENPKISRKDIAEIIGNITEDGVKYQLNKLQKKGAIRRIGPDRGGHWEVIDDSKE